MFDEIKYIRYFLMFPKIPRPSSTAATIEAKLSSSRTISEASRETSVPTIAMATPMSDFLSAGASFAPLPGGDDAELVGRGDPGIHLDVGDFLRQLVVGHLLELPAGHYPALVEDADLSGYRGGGDRMVSRDHHDADARTATRRYRGRCLRSGRIDQTSEAEKGHALLRRGQQGVRFAGYAEDPDTLAGKGFRGTQDAPPCGLVE